MKYPLPGSEGSAAPSGHWRRFLVAAVWVTVGCQAAEPFKVGADAHSSPINMSGSGGAGGAENTGGTGGLQYGSGGDGGSGSVGAGGSGSGGSSTGGSGGGPIMDASSTPDVSNGSGGSTQPDASMDVAVAPDTGRDTGAVDYPPETGPSYCARTGWTATASASSSSTTRPPAGIDGNLTTRWGNGRTQNGTDWYQVDFGGPVRLDSITLDNSMTYPSDYPGGYAVYGSTDGTTFGGPFATGSGAEPRTVISFPMQTVRAIRINQTGTSRPFWWQIGELQIRCL